MSHKPLISIIICTRDRAGDLRQTLAALAQVCAPQSLPTELIAVDNASADNTAEVIQQCRLPMMPVRYLHEPRGGKGYAYNAGLAAALGDVMLLTDDDVRPPKNWITDMASPILRGKVDALAGGVKFAPHLQRDWMQPPHRWSLADTDRLDARAPSDMVGANMAFSRRVLSKVPAFDVEIGPGARGFSEDWLFSAQLQEAGYRIGGALDVTVEHHFQESRLLRASFLSAAEKYGRSFAYLAYHWRHDEPEHLRLLLTKRRLRLAYGRARRRSETRAAEGIPLWEMNVLTDIHYYTQLLRERRGPRLYEKRGLVKIGAAGRKAAQT